MKEELTTAMHSEFMNGDYTAFEMKILGVKSRMDRGYTLKQSCDFYKVTEKEYKDNLDRVMKM